MGTKMLCILYSTAILCLTVNQLGVGHTGQHNTGMGTKLLCILISSGILFLVVNQPGVLGATDVIMTPESDLFLFVGDDLELNCTIRHSNSLEVNQSYVSLLNIKLNNERPPGANLTYDHERKTLQMYKKNITYGDAGFYICYYNDTFKNLKKVNIGDVIMTPESDLFLFVGDDLELNCTIRHSNSLEVNQSYVSLLNIKLNNERPPGANLTYDHERKTLQMYKKNITYGDAGFYICYYNDTFKNLKKVNIGELQRKPDNLYCISKNFEDMTCFVDVYTNSSLPTNWTMMFRTNSNSPWLELPSTNCSDNKQSKPSCQWNPVTKQGSVSGFTFERMIDYYEVRVTSTTRLGNSTSDVIKFKPEDIVKPAAFTSLVTNMTSVSSRVELSWRCPRYSSICNRVPLEFMVTVICQEDWNIPDIHLPVTMDMNYTVTDLIPHAKYTFQVQGKPNTTEGDIYWSDPIDDNITTHSDIPGRSTTVNTGSFIVLDCSTTELCIVLYWKNPEPKYRHGEIKNYSIEIKQDRINEQTKEALSTSKVSPATTDNASNVLTELKSTETLSGLRVYARLITKLLKNMSYTGKMWVSSDKGNSTAFTQFSIPNWSQGYQVRVSWVAVEMSEDGVLVSWDMSSEHCHNVTEVTYYWCSTNQDIHGNSSYIMCQDDFDWAIRYVQKGCGNITFDWLNKTQDKYSYKFAVSIATGNISGGMEWETLRFNGYQSVPDEPLYSVSVEKTSLIISMLHGEYYIGEGGRPHMYHVIYKAVAIKTNKQICPTDGIEVSVPVDFSNTTLVIPLGSSNLIPGSRYIVCVRSSNQFGVGTYGKPQLATIMNNNMPKNEDVYFLLLGLFVGLTVIVLVSVGINKVYKKIQLKNKKFPVRSILPAGAECIKKNFKNGSSKKFTTSRLIDDETTSLLTPKTESDSGCGNDTESLDETDTNVSGKLTVSLIPELSTDAPLQSDQESGLKICNGIPSPSQQNTTDYVVFLAEGNIFPVIDESITRLPNPKSELDSGCGTDTNVSGKLTVSFIPEPNTDASLQGHQESGLNMCNKISPPSQQNTSPVIDDSTTSLLTPKTESDSGCGNDTESLDETDTNVSGNLTVSFIPAPSTESTLQSDQESGLKICNGIPSPSQQNTTDYVFFLAEGNIFPVIDESITRLPNPKSELDSGCGTDTNVSGKLTVSFIPEPNTDASLQGHQESGLNMCNKISPPSQQNTSPVIDDATTSLLTPKTESDNGCGNDTESLDETDTNVSGKLTVSFIPAPSTESTLQSDQESGLNMCNGISSPSQQNTTDYVVFLAEGNKFPVIDESITRLPNLKSELDCGCDTDTNVSGNLLVSFIPEPSTDASLQGHQESGLNMCNEISPPSQQNTTDYVVFLADGNTSYVIDDATTSLLTPKTESDSGCGNDTESLDETDTNVSGKLTYPLITESSTNAPLQSDHESGLNLCKEISPPSQQNTTDYVVFEEGNTFPGTNTLSHNNNQRYFDIPDVVAANALPNTTNILGYSVPSSEFSNRLLENDCEINLDYGFENHNKLIRTQHNTNGFVGDNSQGDIISAEGVNSSNNDNDITEYCKATTVPINMTK